MSVSIVNNDKIQYFSSGYANMDTKYQADKNTLYELASVRKAYTATGILLLEQKGKLELNNSIQKYLPWFTFQYKGKPVDMSQITLETLLHHTSGLANSKHTHYIPFGNKPDMLQKAAKNLKDAELEFYPSEQYSYGTINYDLLGLVIEIVTSQS